MRYVTPWRHATGNAWAGSAVSVASASKLWPTAAALDAALSSVEQAADPQTDAAIKIVAWLTAGIVKPAAGDFAMLRLVLLALLPQIGGILLMIGRAH